MIGNARRKLTRSRAEEQLMLEALKWVAGNPGQLQKDIQRFNRGYQSPSTASTSAWQNAVSRNITSRAIKAYKAHLAAK